MLKEREHIVADSGNLDGRRERKGEWRERMWNRFLAGLQDYLRLMFEALVKAFATRWVDHPTEQTFFTQKKPGLV